jgi:hypothetical protein
VEQSPYEWGIQITNPLISCNVMNLWNLTMNEQKFKRKHVYWRWVCVLFSFHIRRWLQKYRICF